MEDRITGLETSSPRKGRGLFSRLVSFKPIISADECPVFMFHRVLDGNEASYDDNICMTKASFEECVVFLKRHFEITPLTDLLNKKPKPPRACLITFDDGWADTYNNAFPILLKHSAPATVFLPTGMIGTDKAFWFDRIEGIVKHLEEKFKFPDARKKMQELIGLRLELKALGTGRDLYCAVVTAFKTLEPLRSEKLIGKIEQKLKIKPSQERTLMNWNEVKEMGRTGIISFGSHGVNHHILTRLSQHKKAYEIRTSREALMAKKINYADSISFPNGNYDQEVLNISREAGYKLLFSASINHCGTGASPLLVHRINFTQKLARNKSLLAYTLLRAKLKKKLYRG